MLASHWRNGCAIFLLHECMAPRSRINQSTHLDNDLLHFYCYPVNNPKKMLRWSLLKKLAQILKHIKLNEWFLFWGNLGPVYSPSESISAQFSFCCGSGDRVYAVGTDVACLLHHEGDHMPARRRRLTKTSARFYSFSFTQMHYSNNPISPWRQTQVHLGIERTSCMQGLRHGGTFNWWEQLCRRWPQHPDLIMVNWAKMDWVGLGPRAESITIF